MVAERDVEQSVGVVAEHGLGDDVIVQQVFDSLGAVARKCHGGVCIHGYVANQLVRGDVDSPTFTIASPSRKQFSHRVCRCL